MYMYLQFTVRSLFTFTVPVGRNARKGTFWHVRPANIQISLRTCIPAQVLKEAGIYSRTSVARIPLGPCKFVLDNDSSCH